MSAALFIGIPVGSLLLSWLGAYLGIGIAKRGVLADVPGPMSLVLVTGGHDLIGTNVTQELRSRGHEVWTRDILQGQDPKHHKANVGSGSAG